MTSTPPLARTWTTRAGVSMSLWPGEENAEWMDDFPEAKEKVLELRKSIIKGSLGDNYGNAEIMLERMLLPCFEFATELRLKYDPEYCEGILDYVSEDKSITSNSKFTDVIRRYAISGFHQC